MKSFHDPTWEPDFAQGMYAVWATTDQHVQDTLDLLMSDPEVALREGCCVYAAIALHERYGFDVYMVSRVGQNDHLAVGAVDDRRQTWLLDGAGLWKADDLVRNMREQYAPRDEWFWAKASYTYARFLLEGNILGIGAQTDNEAYTALVDASGSVMHQHMQPQIDRLLEMASGMRVGGTPFDAFLKRA